MAFIEKNERTVDRHRGPSLHVRDTTYLKDDVTGEIDPASVKHHRFVVDVGDDTKAAGEGLTTVANEVWTPEVRQKAKEKKDKQ